MLVNGERLAADPSGALHAPGPGLLAVADLHFEEGSAFAGRGTLLPPYDSRATLARLDGGAWRNITDLPLWGAGLDSSGMEGEAGTYDELSELHFGYPSLHRTSGNEVLVAFWCLEGWTCNIRWIRIGLGKDGD